MGTLTADCPRLDEHCPHKLATSCRLTSTPNCCACADNRPHSRTYSVYIDGVGFVQRGTRWQSYCWFCKEFWTNRLNATDPPLQATDTQIPATPDPSAFLQRWFEFHQGYRIVKRADGTEDRIAVIGEPFRDVSPGFLPRTLEELRRRVENDASRAANRFGRNTTQAEEEVEEAPQQSLEEALDDLLAEASDNEETDTTTVQEPENTNDMPTLWSGLTVRGIGGGVLRDGRERARDRLVRVFGTREDVQRDDYQSPVSTMFDRAWGRYRQREDLRRDSANTNIPVLEGLTPQDRHEMEQRVLWSVFTDSREEVLPSSASAPLDASLTLTNDTSTTQRTSTDLEQLRLASAIALAARVAPHIQDVPAPSLDNPDRPPPLTDEERMKDLSCRICYTQIADVVVLPCGHMCMCKWCADATVPVKHSNFVAKDTPCPMCRKVVKQRFKIHIG